MSTGRPSVDARSTRQQALTGQSGRLALAAGGRASGLLMAASAWSKRLSHQTSRNIPPPPEPPIFLCIYT